jgi:hypothetical protein
MTGYRCGRCGRTLDGPTGATCPSCRDDGVKRVDLLVALLVGLAFGACLLAGVL